MPPLPDTLVVVALGAAPAAALLALIVGRWSADAAARVATGAIALGFLAAATMIVLASLDPRSAAIDALGLTLLALVLGLGGLIQSFAIRYLRADAHQRWFVVTASLVTAATAALVTSTTVLGFTIAWLATGVAVVALLATYRPLAEAREGVRRTAVRFALGDAGLVVAAAVVVVTAGGDVALGELDRVAAALPPAALVGVGLLLVLPVLARCSQVPFQSWLAVTLAAPTPVSALMHAGVVNGGAVLVIRFADLMVPGPALPVLFAAATVTVVTASAARLARPDVKGRLVQSTIAQMAFMLLATALGAFAAAVFHLVAHALFKATAFLGAGSGVAQAAEERDFPASAPAPVWRVGLATAAALVVPTAALLAGWAIAPDALAPASAALQVFLLLTAGVALGTLLARHLSVVTALGGSALIAGVVIAYAVVVSAAHTVLGLPDAATAVSAWWLLVPGAGLAAVTALPSLRGPIAARLYSLALAWGSPRSARTTPARIRPTRLEVPPT